MTPMRIELRRNSPLFWKADEGEALVEDGEVVTVTTTKTVGEEGFGVEESAIVVVAVIVAGVLMAAEAQ